MEEIEKFLEIYSLSRLNKKETDKLNRSITKSEMKILIKKIQNIENSRREEVKLSLFAGDMVVVYIENKTIGTNK